MITPETTGRCGGALRKSNFRCFPAAVGHDDAASDDFEIV